MIRYFWCWSHTIECGQQCKLFVADMHGHIEPPTECPYNLSKKPIWKDIPTAPQEIGERKLRGMKKLKVREWKWSVGYGINNTREHEGLIDGVVATRYGFVSVYSQGDERHAPHTYFRLIINGICYVRSINRRYTLRGIARLAKRFAKEIATEGEV